MNCICPTIPSCAASSSCPNSFSRKTIWKCARGLTQRKYCVHIEVARYKEGMVVSTTFYKVWLKLKWQLGKISSKCSRGDGRGREIGVMELVRQGNFLHFSIATRAEI